MDQGENKWILGVDTSRKGLHLALLSLDGACEHSRRNILARGESLGEECSLLLQEHGLTLADVGSVIVALGPGSFTGLRTGIAFCQGLCATGSRRLFGVSSLDFLRSQFPQVESTNHAVLIPARPGYWYMSCAGEYFLSEAEIVHHLANIAAVFSDNPFPSAGALSEWQGEWHKLDVEWRFSKLIPLLEQIEPKIAWNANYLQPSYAEQKPAQG